MDKDDIHSSGPDTGSHEGLPDREELRKVGEQLSETARQEYGELREEAVHAMHEAADATRHQVRAYTERQHHRAADHIVAVAQAMQDSAGSLEAQGEITMASYWKRAADETQNLAKWTEEKSLEEMWKAAEQYAREHPGVAFGGAVAAGFVLARVLSSSAPRT